MQESNQYTTVTLSIEGMRCHSCVVNVSTTLMKHPGVVKVDVDLSRALATVGIDPVKVTPAELEAAVKAIGYRASLSQPDNPQPIESCCRRPLKPSTKVISSMLGVLAAFAIVGIYLGMNTLTADWYFAKIQFSEYRWWIIALAIGLGIQVTLFALFKARLRRTKSKVAVSSMAASGGMSTVAMMACCSHYLAVIVPTLGIPFLSAAAVAQIAEYQSYFFLAGVLSCLTGIGLMLRMMDKHGMLPTGGVLENLFNLRLRRVNG
jgi:cation transport ATPase